MFVLSFLRSASLPSDHGQFPPLMLQHVSSGPIPFRTKPGLTYDFLRGLIARTLEMLRWRIFGTGPYASLEYSSTALVRSTDNACVLFISLCSAQRFNSSPRSLPYYIDGSAGAPVNDHASGPGAPDLELLWAPQAVFGHGFPKPSPSTDGVTFSAVALKPESRGQITLKSNSVWDTPLIDPK